MFAYSKRHDGDMRDAMKQETFLRSLHLPYNLIMPEQVHGTEIVVVSSKDIGKKIPNVDGLVGKLTSDQNFTLGVFVADCVPLLFLDPKKRIIGASHAGWRGTLGKITKNIIDTMKTLGAQQKDILVSIGPHIGMCCYDVSADRAKLFREEFHDEPKVSSLIEGKWHIDLGYANFLTLIDAGVLTNHIDGLPTCTSCQIDTYFSYRKDAKETFGEMMGVVAWKT